MGFGAARIHEISRGAIFKIFSTGGSVHRASAQSDGQKKGVQNESGKAQVHDLILELG